MPSRRSREQIEQDRKADDLARRAKCAPKGKKLELAIRTFLARTEALKEGPPARGQ